MNNIVTEEENSIICDPTQPPSITNLDKNTILEVQNLTRNVSDEHLKEIFSVFADIQHAYILRDRIGIPVGRGYIYIRDKIQAKICIYALHRGQIDGATIYVNIYSGITNSTTNYKSYDTITSSSTTNGTYEKNSKQFNNERKYNYDINNNREYDHKYTNGRKRRYEYDTRDTVDKYTHPHSHDYRYKYDNEHEYIRRNHNEYRKDENSRNYSYYTSPHDSRRRSYQRTN